MRKGEPTGDQFIDGMADWTAEQMRTNQINDELSQDGAALD